MWLNMKQICAFKCDESWKYLADFITWLWFILHNTIRLNKTRNIEINEYACWYESCGFNLWLCLAFEYVPFPHILIINFLLFLNSHSQFCTTFSRWYFHSRNKEQFFWLCGFHYFPVPFFALTYAEQIFDYFRGFRFKRRSINWDNVWARLNKLLKVWKVLKLLEINLNLNKNNFKQKIESYILINIFLDN